MEYPTEPMLVNEAETETAADAVLIKQNFRTQIQTGIDEFGEGMEPVEEMYKIIY